MQLAYVLIQTQMGQASAVVDQLASLPGVIVASEVSGPYDVIVEVEADSIDGLTSQVLSGIEKHPGITRILTCPVASH